ncbi:MAG: sodium:proton antiporter NhaD [Pseudomonadota bacterium]
MSALVVSAATGGLVPSDPVTSTPALVALGVFAVGYLLVMLEEVTHLRKSKPMLIAAGIIWAMVAWDAANLPKLGPHGADHAFRETFLEFAELFGFLLVAMTYVNALTERNVFEALRSWLVRRRLGYRAVFWVTGGLAFLLSPVVDNMTTALLMGAVVLAVARANPRFVTLASINVVVAANASGAFSPFGDVTTLMVWQRDVLPFFTFFYLVVPAVVNWAIPAVIMSLAVPGGIPEGQRDDVRMKLGAKWVMALFALTITFTVVMRHEVGLPAVYGMLMGLGFLQLFGYFLQRAERRVNDNGALGQVVPFDIFRQIALVEWDTMLFFYGVILSVGGLAAFGYLDWVAGHIYGSWGATAANVAVGVASAVVDNIPIMFAVLTMHPAMDVGQWLLVTMTAGVGGSLLSIGSAAGVALMGQARGAYTFSGHLKWSWAVALGYAASILAHQMLNSGLFTNVPLQ